MLPLKELPTDIIDSKLVKCLDFEDTKQLRHTSHAFFNNQQLLASQANLERQLNQPRLLISECGDVIYTRKALYISIKSSPGSWDNVQNQTFILKDLKTPYYKIKVKLAPDEKVIQIATGNDRVFLLTNLGQPLQVSKITHVTRIYSYSSLRMRKIEFHPTNPDEQLIKLSKSVFISNHRNAYQHNLGLDSLDRVTLTPAMSFNIFQNRHYFLTSDNHIYLSRHDNPDSYSRLPVFPHGTIHDIKYIKYYVPFILNKEGQLFTLGKSNEEYYVHIFSKKVKSIFASQNHFMLITEDEKIYSFGKNDFGQLDIGNKMDTAFFTEAPLSMKLGEYIVTNQCGPHFSAITTNQGRVLVSGAGFMEGLNTQHFINRHCF